MNATEWLISKNNYTQKNNFTSIYKNPAKTLCFLSGKGGVGKTTCALKMAQELSRTGKKVLLVDCDFNLSNTGVKLGINHPINLIDINPEFDNLDDCINRDWDCDIIFAGNGALSFYDRDESDYLQLVLNTIQKLERQYDQIILDLPAGCSRAILSLSSYCDQRIFVVTPDKSSLTDSYSVIKLLNKMYGVNSNELLLNKVQSKLQTNKISNSLISTSERFLDVHLRLLGVIEFLDESFEKFDETIFDGKNSPLEKNMQKIIKNFSDEVGATHFDSKLFGQLNAATGCQPTSQGV